MAIEPQVTASATTTSAAARPRVDVQLGGLLGAALDANRRGRLSTFIVDADSPAIALFAPGARDRNREGDWYGEHAGKWLAAAAHAAARSGDPALLARARAVADFLVSVQEDDGYLGTYARGHRFMDPQPPKPVTWDGAPSVRTWDIWTHSYLVLGLLALHGHFPDDRYLAAARRIGDLCWRTLTDGGIDITALGNHFGMSATVLMDPAMALHAATGEQRYLDLALLVLAQAEAEPRLALLSRARDGADASEIATGKAYQLGWNLVGLAKIARATGDAAHRAAVEHLWRNIRDHHLTLGGGPWGGVAHRSREVFNPAGVFSPQGYVETCSTLAWIQLNRELLAITGDPCHAEEIERSAYNDLLAAQAPDGEDWCYYVFPNGRRVHTTYWRCCKSSGAMALEELPPLALALDTAGDIAVHLYGPMTARLVHPDAGDVVLAQDTGYPFDGDVVLQLDAARPATYALRLRIPAWADGATLEVDGVAFDGPLVPGTQAVVRRAWPVRSTLRLRLPMRARTHRALQRNVQESRAPDGSAVAQEVLRYEYLAITRGPLVYATGLVDGWRLEETLPLPDDADALLSGLPADGDGLPGVSLVVPGRAPLDYRPYFAAGGRRDGAWRLTWMPLAPVPAPAP